MNFCGYKTALRYLLTGVTLLSLFLAGNASGMPLFAEVKRSYQQSESVLLDRNGEAIHRMRLDRKGRRLDWTSLKDISPALINAVIQSEDRRFRDHHGVDWRAVAAAAAGNILSGGSRGASTLSMQLASMLDRTLKPRAGHRSMGQKWDQMGAAGELERAWSKDEILEAYLNLVTYRGELQGVASASLGLFSKEPAGLDEKESIILAALIRSPNAAAGDVARRACRLAADASAGAGCAEIEQRAADTLSRPYNIKQPVAAAPQAARKLLKRPGDRKVSTIDARLQKLAADAIRGQLNELGRQNVNDGAVLVVDNASGDILAYVGSGRRGQHVDGIQAKRQAGSTLKPFLYEFALERRLLTAASVLDDSPVNIPTTRGLYVPRNYDNEYKGPVSVRTALSSSLNVPAVRTLVLTGVEPFLDRLRALGFDLRDPAEHYGYSLALGTADVSLYELVNAYRSLAAKGRQEQLRLSFDEKRLPPKQVMHSGAAHIIGDILSDRGARSITFGLENVLSTRFWTAVKTGTSKDMRDNWCIGYSRKYTVGVWVGNFSGEAMWNVSGVSGAAPVWIEVMNYLHRGADSAPPDLPAEVTAAMIDLAASSEGKRRELFIRGTEPVRERGALLAGAGTTGPPSRIVYPVEGTLIALDPDIPEPNQAILISVSNPSREQKLVLEDGSSWTAVESALWRPQPGRHTLTLTDAGGTIVDRVQFEVRGTASLAELN